MVRQHEVLDAVLGVLNNSNYMNDPLGNERTGSFAFSPTQRITYNRQMPKIQVKYAEDATGTDKSYGGAFKGNKGVSLDIYIYVPQNIKQENIHDDSIIREIEDDIEDALVKGRNEIPMTIDDFGDVIEPAFDKEQMVKVGVKPVTFIRRKQYG